MTDYMSQDAGLHLLRQYGIIQDEENDATSARIQEAIGDLREWGAELSALLLQYQEYVDPESWQLTPDECAAASSVDDDDDDGLSTMSTDDIIPPDVELLNWFRSKDGGPPVPTTYVSSEDRKFGYFLSELIGKLSDHDAELVRQAVTVKQKDGKNNKPVPRIPERPKNLYADTTDLSTYVVRHLESLGLVRKDNIAILYRIMKMAKLEKKWASALTTYAEVRACNSWPLEANHLTRTDIEIRRPPGLVREPTLEERVARLEQKLKAA